MRRPRFLWTSAFAAVGFSALSAPAQQPRRASNPSPAASSSDSVDLTVDPMMSSRAARYLLRNGLDYLNYREYDRALNFFRVIETRQGELTDQERQQLRKGIARAQQGKREAVNGPHVVAHPQGRPTNPPGAFALAKPATTARPSAGRPLAPEPVQLTSGTMPAADIALASTPTPSPNAGVPSAPAPLDSPVAVVAPPSTPDGLELPTLPAAPPESLFELAMPAAGTTPMPAAPVGPATPQPQVAPAPGPAADQASPLELPILGSPAPVQAPALDPAATPAEATSPALPSIVGNDMPTLPQEPAPAPEPAPSPEPAPTDQPVAVVAPSLGAEPAQTPAPAQDPAPAPAQAQPRASLEPPPAADVAMPSPTTIPSGVDPDRSAPAPVGSNPGTESFLTSRHREEIERLAQRPSESSPAGDRASAANPTNDPNASNGPTQGSTRLELQRAPSPTEARPIRRIPVPEEFVPLGRRDWTPNRKYWAAAGTCHMILYFQDPALERYGQGVEQALGTRGRYFSYPLDDPKQSNQRNQILQPFYSIGKFCFQVGTLPYKLVVDPPWEAEYDLGYYRPGDKVPTDTVVITPTGVGPPLKGRKY